RAASGAGRGGAGGGAWAVGAAGGGGGRAPPRPRGGGGGLGPRPPITRGVNTDQATTEVFVARQPIFDRHRQVYAYELLFRSGLKNAFGGVDPDRASVKVIADSFLRFGLQRLTGGKRAFINFTRDTLVKGYATPLPKDSIVVEILENVEQDHEVFDACRELKRRGYMIALDDVVCDDWDDPLIGFADIIKVDFRGTDARTKAALPGLIAARKIK